MTQDESKLSDYLNRINDIMCESFLIKNHEFGRVQGEKIMDILEEWANNE